MVPHKWRSLDVPHRLLTENSTLQTVNIRQQHQLLEDGNSGASTPPLVKDYGIFPAVETLEEYQMVTSPLTVYTQVTCMFFGKGQSTTSVTAPNMGVTAGDSITITGTVMDMSPGDQGSITNPTQPLDSLTKAGTVPCVSDGSMETQMEYLYMQYPIDGTYHNVTMTGVPVKLTAIGSDGTVINLGTATTNAYYGTYGLTWTPTKADTYTITASFDGSDSYGSSSAATSISVGTTTNNDSTHSTTTTNDTR